MNNRIAVQYALLCLQELDRGAGTLSSHQISIHQGIPLPECEEILGKLTAQGLVDLESRRHYRLARPIGDITALDVLQALARWVPRWPVFRLLYDSSRLALRKTLQAVHFAQGLNTFPGDRHAGSR